MDATRAAPAEADNQEIKRLVDVAQDIGKADSYTGKRHWTRFRAGMACELTTDPSLPSARWFATLHNVSGGGLALWSKKKFPLHQRIYVREFNTDGAPAWVEAQVCHCTNGIRGFLIGASFVRPIDPERPLHER